MCAPVHRAPNRTTWHHIPSPWLYGRTVAMESQGGAGFKSTSDWPPGLLPSVLLISSLTASLRSGVKLVGQQDFMLKTHTYTHARAGMHTQTRTKPHAVTKTKHTGMRFTQHKHKSCQAHCVSAFQLFMFTLPYPCVTQNYGCELIDLRSLEKDNLVNVVYCAV